MNLLYMKYAIEVAKTGSINKAAENLGVAQPNMSRAIKELEESTKSTLFVRSPKGMVTTPEGDKFIAQARNIMKQIDEMEHHFADNALPHQEFSISVPRATYISSAFAMFTKFLEEDRPTEIIYKETTAIDAIHNVIDGVHNLAIVRYSTGYESHFKSLFSENNLKYELIAEFTYHLIFNKESFLADLNEIRISDLDDYLEITHADPTSQTQSLSKVRKYDTPDQKDKVIVVYERASQYDVLSTNPDTYMWVSPTPHEILDKYNLMQRRCVDSTREYNDVLIYRNGYELTELDKRFITELKESEAAELKPLSKLL